MSFILDSLKKLEQEKAEQNREMDLKAVLLKTEESEKEVMQLKTKLRTLLAVSAGVLIVGVVMAIVFFKGTGPEVIASAPNPLPAVKKEPPEDMPAAETPLSLMTERDFPPPPPPPPPETGEVAPIPEFVVQNLEGAFLETKVSRQDSDTPARHKDFLPPPLPVIPIPEAAKARFPRFDIKGIVFFGEGNPDNYIMLYGAGGERSKLKEGDTFMRATLMEILPEKARFLFEENLFEKEMGKD